MKGFGRVPDRALAAEVETRAAAPMSRPLIVPMARISDVNACVPASAASACWLRPDVKLAALPIQTAVSSAPQAVRELPDPASAEQFEDGEGARECEDARADE